MFESGVPVISAYNDSLNACSQLSGLPNSLTFNEVVTLNASSVDFSKSTTNIKCAYPLKSYFSNMVLLILCC